MLLSALTIRPRIFFSMTKTSKRVVIIIVGLFFAAIISLAVFFNLEASVDPVVLELTVIEGLADSEPTQEIKFTNTHKSPVILTFPPLISLYDGEIWVTNKTKPRNTSYLEKEESKITKWEIESRHKKWAFDFGCGYEKSKFSLTMKNFLSKFLSKKLMDYLNSERKKYQVVVSDGKLSVELKSVGD